MTDFRSIALWHCGKYPQMEPQDLIKLAYQSAYGSEHMLADREAVLRYLQQELSQTPQRDEGLFEPIGGELCRLNLAAMKKSGLLPETVAGLFGCASREKNAADLEESLHVLEKLSEEKTLPVSEDTMKSYLANYREAGRPAVHHSERFRKAYHPAYRIVPDAAAAFLPLFQHIDALLRTQNSVRVAIDGRCASGKSTLGELLAKTYDANLFHMDDFFLPPERKTPQRLAQPGGNVDYERFQAEIGVHGNHESFTYQPYRCHLGMLDAPVSVQPRRVFVVEGAYSLHPALRAGYDLRVFVSISPELQSRRILKRNGEAMHHRFMTEWIPLEERYFAAERVCDLCDLCFNAEDFAKFYREFGLD